MLADTQFTASVASVFKKEYFNDSTVGSMFEFISNHFRQYNQLPPKDIAIESVKDSEGIFKEIDAIDYDIAKNYDHLLQETNLYLKEQAYKNALMAGVELIESGKDILQYKSIVDEALSKDLTGDSQELMSICDLERMNIPERKTLISEWLKDKSYMIVCARRGVGKTHFTWGIAKAVSLNLEFSHWKRGNLDEEYPNVMILDGEMPIEELIERQRSHRMPKNIYIRSAVYQEDYRNYKGLLLNENYRNLIHRQCQEHNIRLLILDNKSSFHPGMEENANGNEWDNVNS